MNPKTNKFFAHIWILCGIVGLFINPEPIGPVVFCVGGVILQAVAEIQEHLQSKEQEKEDESDSR